jgi:hypothetical protein
MVFHMAIFLLLMFTTRSQLKLPPVPTDDRGSLCIG